MNCLIVDDEPNAVKVIESHVSKIDELNVVGTCNSALEALSLLNKVEVDILFLDIEMPVLDGLSFLKSLKNPPFVLITTAHRNFALDSFDLDVVDYLLKPISLDRFIQAITKVFRIRNKPLYTNLDSDLASTSGEDDFIFIKSERENLKVSLPKILFIESLKNHVKIYLEDQTYITHIGITEIKRKLPVNFIRIHKSYVINTNQIKSYTNTYVTINRKTLPIGNVYKSMVLDVLGKKSI